MRIFALSDLHIEQAINRAWVERLSETDYRDDILILAGDLSDTLALIEWGLGVLASRFRKVLYVPGNHDLWVLREPASLLSTGKLERLRALCAERNVSMTPYHCGELSVVPLFSWYDDSFSVPSAELRERWMDYRACRWPAGLHGDGINAHFLGMNDAALQVRNRIVVSFSHFVPRADLLPSDSATTRMLLPVMGSAGLDAQIRRLQPAIHVFGHSHRNLDVAREGIRYVNCALGYPSERREAPTALPCILDLASDTAQRLTDNPP